MRGMRIPFAALVATLLALPGFAQIQSPEAFLGHAIGADGKLASYTDLERYWKALEVGSPRMQLEAMGETSYGQTQWLAVISSPANLARLDAIRAGGRELALGRIENETAAHRLAAKAPAIVWIDGGLHASESIAGQNILELVWRMVSQDDEEVRRILDAVVLLVCPANPDGMEMISLAYRATGRVGLLPVLYQRYIGHDNNRDHYAGNQLETRNIQHALYHRWLPQIVYNHHQPAPRGTIIFTPPFRDPFNFEFDPLVVRGIDLIAAQMNYRFASEGKPGVISRSGAPYSTWWNGGLRTTAYFHNMIGILTEVFGSPDPVPLRQALNRRLPSVDYPDPIGTQTWHARQTVEYLQTANFAILDHASRYREQLVLDQWRMARRAIARGSSDHWTVTPQLMARARSGEVEPPEQVDGGESEPGAPSGDQPRAEAPSSVFDDPAARDPQMYVIPADQPDFAAAVRLVRALRRCAVEVECMTEDDTLADGTVLPRGSFVISTAQAFRAHLRDMLEPQWHPDDVGSSGEPIRPYDSAGWTLSMQMDVRVLRLLESVALPTEPVGTIEVPIPIGSAFGGTGVGWLIDARDSNLWPIVHGLWAAGIATSRATESFDANGRSWSPGTFYVSRSAGAELAIAATIAEVGGDAHPIAVAPQAKLQRLSAPRVGLFHPFGGDMATGWTEWVLQEFGFRPVPVFGARVESGALRDDFDALLFCTGLPPATQRGRRDAALGGRGRGATQEQAEKLAAALPPFEDWSTLEQRRARITRETGVPALLAFVETGGTLIALGSAVTAAIDLFELPVDHGVKVDGDDGPREANSGEFFIPGSLLWLEVDPGEPSAFGMSPRHAAMFRRSTVLEPREGARATAWWAREAPILASGWARGGELLHGKAAAVEVERGAGRFVLFGADVVYRGQPVGTFKLLFDAIATAAATPR